MKIVLLFLLPSVFLISCNSTKKIAAPTPDPIEVQNPVEPGMLVADGSSFSRAIIIQAKDEKSGVDAEYNWLSKNYPGYSSDKQSLTRYQGKPFDVLVIVTAKGETKKVYFDISGFFGKF